jgi:transposase
MFADLLLPNGAALRLDSLDIQEQMITIAVTATQMEAACPGCSQTTRRVHSGYTRTVADLAWAGRRVRLQLRARRFFCPNATCTRQTFTERLPGVVAPSARRTPRLAETQREMGFALGGQAGARRLEQLGMPTSPDTLLRLVDQRSQPPSETPRVLGVDDFAWKKRQSYGTILVDLEQHRVIDLLPDRSSDSLANWLQTHPGVQIISRDRGGTYAEGARRGAPEAIQVADRWHLLANLREALEHLLIRMHVCLPIVAKPEVHDPAPVSPRPEERPELRNLAAAEVQPQAEQIRLSRRTRRLLRYEQVVDLHEQGLSMRSIAEQMGLGRQTVRRYLAAGTFPEISRRKKMPSLLDRFEPYLHQRWEDGCHNAMQLFREIHTQGYRGSRPLLSRWAAQMRRVCHKSAKHAQPDRNRVVRRQPPKAHRLSPSQAAWLLVRKPANLTADEQAAIAQMHQTCPEMIVACNLAQDFATLVRERQPEALPTWLQSTQASGPAELQSFANGLLQDLAAVTAGLSLPWSNGQTEGQINRLKLVKRMMYGRAKFPLLRQRILVPI